MGSSASIKRAKGEDWSENGATLVSLEPGDLVKFQRCGYYHWAVYIGNGEVVHVSEQNNHDSVSDKSLVRASLELSKVHINVQSFWAVARSGRASKANDRDQDWSPLPNDEIVERATNFVGMGDVCYNLFTCNCEHFAKWCRYDRFRSDQVDRLKIYKPKVIMKGVISAFDAAKNKVKIHISKDCDRQGGQEIPNSFNEEILCQKMMKKEELNDKRELDDDIRDKMKEIETSNELHVSPSGVSYIGKVKNNLNSF
ncbi:hypothetical protein RRG08_037281 [Elysia crispata]|uniref:LRAT domain-containing protein n=1 Tax=Elysia crispata TaxID=231223 RepID=A0AAE0XX94_9GAST|nr:hypothetical protein RRG08_037281 [Elysia crispata]